MKLLKLLKTIFILITILYPVFSVVVTKLRNKGNSETLYKKIKSYMKECKVNKEKCCSSTALWIKSGIMLNEKKMLHKTHMEKGNLANTIDLKIDQIKTSLEQQKIVYIAINPDHHFIVFKDAESNFVDIYQSFMDYYTLQEWIKHYYKNKNQLTFTDFINRLREFMKFDPSGNKLNLDGIKNDSENIKKLFCIKGLFKKKFPNSIKNWFYDFKFLTRRFFKRITYSDFPDEKSIYFMSCQIGLFNYKFNKFSEEIKNEEYNK